MTTISDRPLGAYRKKRDFGATPEPRGGVPGPRKRVRFVVQRHEARTPHYDFRLEWAGVLKSWAVPKGPSMNPGDKRLAIEVEDHPLEYRKFSGTIPKGQYGAGHVMIWDQGTWQPGGDFAHGLSDGRIEFTLRGQRLKGGWRLIRLRGRSNRHEWLLLKKEDAYATRSTVAAADVHIDPVKTRGTTARAPGKIMPQLATEVTDVPDGPRWLSELKLDGYRLLVHVDGATVRCYSRNGIDWSKRFGRITETLRSLKLADTWLDGEVIVADEQGRSDFQRLQQQLEAAEQSGLMLYVFDIPVASGADLRDRPLIERKRILQKTLAGLADSNVRLLEYIDGFDRLLWKELCKTDHEGLIVKDADAPYRAGRSRTWLKLKCRRVEDFIIGGFTRREGGRSDLAALLLGTYRGKRLAFVGRAGTGFNEESLSSLRRRLQEDLRTTAPFDPEPALRRDERPRWVEPRLVAQVRFAGWTQAGLLRHPVFLALREDREPRDVTSARTTPQGGAVRKGSRTSIAGPSVTHSTRVVFPEDGITKVQLAAYYEAIRPALWPHLRDRPLSVLRSVAQGKNFYQRHLDDADAAGFRRVSPPAGSSAAERYFAATSDAAVSLLAQMGAVELHTWGSRVPRADLADRLTFDVDPAPSLDWKPVCSAAALIRDFLAELGLESQLKTSGGLGLHVVVPLQGRLPDFETAADFTRRIATQLAHAIPELFTARRGAANRKDRMYIDWQRNQRGATTVAAYSPRWREGVPVSMPLAWSDLGNQDLRGPHFNLRNAVARFHRLGDPWIKHPCKRQTLTARVLRNLEKVIQ